MVASGIAANGVPPTLRELSDAMGGTVNSVIWYHLGQLVDGGYLTRVPGAARALQITAKGRASLGDANPTASALETAVRDAIAAGAKLPDSVVAALEAVA